MESHSCKEIRVEGVASRTSTSNLEPLQAPSSTAPEIALCQHVDARGRRCRMAVVSDPTHAPAGDNSAALLSPSTAGLCGYHARRLFERERANQTAAAELLSFVGDFTDAAAVNRFLGNLIKQVALKRISRRDGVALAYICQLLLNSLGALDRRELLRLEQARLDTLRAKQRPRQIIWDIPVGPHASGQDATPKRAGNLVHNQARKEPSGCT